MANHKSSEKRARQAIRKNARNSAVEGSVRTFEKRLRAAIASGDKKTAQTVLNDYMSKVSKAAAKGVVHAKTASRKISRISTRVSGMAAAK